MEAVSYSFLQCRRSALRPASYSRPGGSRHSQSLPRIKPRRVLLSGEPRRLLLCSDNSSLPSLGAYAVHQTCGSGQGPDTATKDYPFVADHDFFLLDEQVPVLIFDNPLFEQDAERSMKNDYH